MSLLLCCSQRQEPALVAQRWNDLGLNADPRLRLGKMSRRDGHLEEEGSLVKLSAQQGGHARTEGS